ncbi:unnamed protein product, partial [Ectocarpus sp. 12 AP-2014]
AGDREEEVATTATMGSRTETSNSGEDEEEEEEKARPVANGAVPAEAPSSDSSLANGAAKVAPPTAAGAGRSEEKTVLAAKETPAATAATSPAAGGKVGALLLPRVVVTGVACGLPGQEEVFERDNLARLLAGQGCVKRLSTGSTAALVEKNVVQVKRQPGGQPPLRIPISKPSQTIKLAATMGNLDMALYGVSPSIAATMDKAVK